VPKSTFFNLTKDKTDKIIKVSIDEFMEYTYENASINRIVENAEIAKGSFYQYFEDKKDLYEYIIEEAQEKKKSYFVDTLNNQSNFDFFEAIDEVFLREINFARELPKQASLILDYNRSSLVKLKRETLTDTWIFRNVYEELIIKGIDNKSLDSDIEIKLYVYLLASLNISILEYYIYEVSYDYSKALNYVSNVVKLLRNGVKENKRTKKSFEDRFY